MIPAPAEPTSEASNRPASAVTLREAARVYASIGLQSFGGPTGQIAVMHRVLVEDKKWLSESRFLHALNFCMLLPGPEAMQLATYSGWLMHGTRGGLLAGTLFVLPGFICMLALSIAYTTLGDAAAVQGLLFGLKAAVLAVVAEAVMRIGKRVLRTSSMYAVAGASFVALLAFDAPFPLVIAGAALLGLAGVGRSVAGEAEPVAAEVRPSAPGAAHAVRVLAVWVPLWLVPVAVLALWFSDEGVFAAQAVFFSKAAMVTFGGAYAVLAYVAQQAVEVHGWLRPDEMLTGLGLAESTPGPLILVLQFVGYVGAHSNPGSLPPILAGIVASFIAAWTTFVPCFLWIFLGAPYMEQLRGKRALAAALRCVTAAVVGVILNLAVWLAVHTLFGSVDSIALAGATLPAPDWRSLDVVALAIAGVSAFALIVLRWGFLRVLACAALIGIAIRMLA